MQRERGGRSRRPWLLPLICGVAVVVVFRPGCTVTDRNYPLMSFFFDGVPDPAALSGPGARVPGVTYFEHKPYTDEACAECHGSRTVQQIISRDDSTMCLKCHEGTPEEHRVMHGPVAAVACLWCHRPHESRYEHLLREPAPELCIQCHGLQLRRQPQPPAHADLERSCLDCHGGHGGPRRLFLKPAWSEPVPEAPESEAPAPTDANRGADEP